MAGALTWSKAALEDIEAIAEFISRGSPRHATRVATALFELGDVIAVHPLAGRTVPELGNARVRERFLHSYRVVYRVQGDRIIVLGVAHGRRLLASMKAHFEDDHSAA